MLASAPLMRERLAKEARYQRRDAPGYSFEFKQMQKSLDAAENEAGRSRFGACLAAVSRDAV
jgi:hypothetical protein